MYTTVVSYRTALYRPYTQVVPRTTAQGCLFTTSTMYMTHLYRRSLQLAANMVNIIIDVTSCIHI
jgi:hypothetical protein